MALRGVGVAVGLHGAHQGDAGRVHGHQDLALLLKRRRFRIRLPHQNHDLTVDVPSPRDPPLRAVDHVVLPLPGDGNADIGSVTRGHGGLCHRETRPDFPLQEGLQPLLLLLGGAKPSQNLHISGIRARTIAALGREFSMARGAQNFAHLAVLQVIQPGALVPRELRRVHGEEQVPEPQGLGFLLQLLQDGSVIPLVPRPLRGLILMLESLLVRVDVLLHELPERLLQGLKLGGLHGWIWGGVLEGGRS
mmetsp:Transcript_33752/g.81748  ORF Transcript_33752/g.81748 Transcript_33752/m.81748 type:complete len:249 (-) Transcript_33752:30-776(-)